MLKIGQILKPQGIRGEVKVKPLTDDPSRFACLKTVYIGNAIYRPDKVRCAADGVYIKFVGIDDRNAAEKLRGFMIEIDRAVAVPLSDGEFFIADLIGSTLAARSQDGGETTIGKVQRIESFGAADVFTVLCDDGGIMTFAFVKTLEPMFDGESKRLSVLYDKLKEVAVYED